MRYFLAAFLLTCFISFSQTVTPVTVAGKILEFSKKNIGKKVDRGECWDLANAALNYANAAWVPPFNYGDKIDYKKQEFKPADIMQFTNVKFIFKNGSASFPQHTAIVYKSHKNFVTVFHQNFNNKRLVDTLTLNLDNIKNGKIEVYRPKGK